jgi:hypothetical protein
MPRKTLLNWCVSVDLKARLRAESERTGAPLAEIVRRAVVRYLDRAPPREEEKLAAATRCQQVLEPKPPPIDPAHQAHVMARIADHLRAAGCSERRLSLRLGVDQAEYSRWKHNHRRIPRARLRQIASILDTPLASLLDPEDQP